MNFERRFFNHPTDMLGRLDVEVEDQCRHKENILNLANELGQSNTVRGDNASAILVSDQVGVQYYFDPSHCVVPYYYLLV